MNTYDLGLKAKLWWSGGESVVGPRCAEELASAGASLVCALGRRGANRYRNFIGKLQNARAGHPHLIDHCW